MPTVDDVVVRVAVERLAQAVHMTEHDRGRVERKLVLFLFEYPEADRAYVRGRERRVSIGPTPHRGEPMDWECCVEVGAMRSFVAEQTNALEGKPS